MSRLELGGIDLSHSRLTELAKLADQAKPFYDWVTGQFQKLRQSKKNLTELLLESTEEEILQGISLCYDSTDTNIPLLTDGVGRSYQHSKACYYFFAWIIRDAPQQRLAPLITRIVSSTRVASKKMQQIVLAKLIFRYRANVGTFEWDAVREIIIDRLEGSRRSIKGHEKETISRTALVAAFQAYFKKHGNYGRFSSVEIPESQVNIAQETFDVSARLLDNQGKCVARVLMPIKTRETEGGGHAHLFTRDLMQALNAIRAEDGLDYLVTVIVARNWSVREAESIKAYVDHAVLFDLSPNEFTEFGEVAQTGLNEFIETLLSGDLKPKKLELPSINGLEET
ncbi:hypothetical protein P8935_07265 [Telmatobacter sp. DSM 110680]|uniref:Uncharacterized protein n=1 Tax=Telmatobacter sp. DSM 110680 TaxID=3036704 RepID=A0AAU7DP83_9BACT